MIRHHARLILTLTLLLVLSVVFNAWGGAPTDQLRDGIGRVAKILHDPALAGEQRRDERRAAVGRVAVEIFDFGDMAKRALGQHWVKRTPAERAEFTGLFTELIQRSYITRVDQHASAARAVTFLSETVEDDYAVVKTRIPLSNGSSMPLDYRMHSTAGQWQVYDLGMDGVSLLANYRAQFNKIIRTSSFEDLVARLKANKMEFAAPSASPAGGKAGR